MPNMPETLSKTFFTDQTHPFTDEDESSFKKIRFHYMTTRNLRLIFLP